MYTSGRLIYGDLFRVSLQGQFIVATVTVNRLLLLAFVSFVVGGLP